MRALFRSSKALLGLLLVCISPTTGCGSAQVPEPKPSATVEVATASAAVPVEPPLLKVEPHASSEGFVARIRVGLIVKARDLIPAENLPGFANDLSDELGLDRGILESPTALSKLGVDPAGVMTFESFEIDDQGKAMVARVRAIKPGPSDEDLAASFGDERKKLKNAGWFLTRIRIPTEGEKLADIVDRALMRRSGQRKEIAPGELAYVVGRSVFHVKKEPKTLLVELALSDRTTSPGDVREALAELGAWAETTAPPLAQGEQAVIRLAPPAVATAGMLLESQRSGAVSELQGDPQVTQRILANVIRDARALDFVDAPTGKPRYASVTFTVTDNQATLTSSLSAGTEALEASDWTEDGADFSVDGALLGYAINGPLLYRWKMISENGNRNPYYAHDILRSAERVGFPAEMLMTGDGPFVLARAALEEAESIGHATLPFLRKWERLGFAVANGNERHAEAVFVGILPQSATEENAACALAVEPKGCPPQDRIRPNAMNKRDGFVVTRKKMSNRWVVLASRRETLLKSVGLHVSVGPHSPYTAWVDPARIGDDLELHSFAGLPTYKMTTATNAEKRVITFTVKPDAPSDNHPAQSKPLQSKPLQSKPGISSGSGAAPRVSPLTR